MTDKIVTLIDARHDLVCLADMFGEELACHPHWLSPGHAVEFAYNGDPDRLEDALLGLAARKPPNLDVAVTSVQNRRKSLILCDMDSTIIDNECIDEIASTAGIGVQVAAITERTMQGELDFEQALIARVALLEGLPIHVFDEILRNRIKVKPGARTLIATMRANGAFAALVSGGFSDFTSHIRSLVGFDSDQSNRLEIRDGVLTGKVVSPILGPAAKQQALERLCQIHDLDAVASMAVGDGANDIEMIEKAGLGVAFHAHEKVKLAANVRIDANDLTALLYIQGYSDADIIRP